MKNSVINVESFLNELISCQDASYKLAQIKEEEEYSAFVPHYLKQLRGEIACMKQQVAVREKRNEQMMARKRSYQLKTM